MELDIPDRLAKAILFVRGQDDGEAWLRALPRRIELYLRRWDLTALEIAAGGAMSCCLFCETADGGEAVLKIPFDAASGRLESRSLARWAEAAASPAVLATAPASGVFLMARVRPGTTAYPAGRATDSGHFVQLVARMVSPELGTMRGLKRIEHVTRTRFEWAYDRFVDAGYELQQSQMPGAERLLEALVATDCTDTVIHGDLQTKNILVGADGTWMAIDPLTCRGDVNAEAALWAVVQEDGSRVEERIAELSGSELLDEKRLRAWCYLLAVAEYRIYQPENAERLKAFTDELHWQDLAADLS